MSIYLRVSAHCFVGQDLPAGGEVEGGSEGTRKAPGFLYSLTPLSKKWYKSSRTFVLLDSIVQKQERLQWFDNEYAKRSFSFP